MTDKAALLGRLRAIAEAAGQETLRFYGKCDAQHKADGSPVTAADEAAESLILPQLRALTPDIPVVSEEEASKGLAPERAGGAFWLVDPLDGTKEFISENGEFTVNIALIENNTPVLGIVVAPALGRTWFGAANAGAFRAENGSTAPIRVRTPPAEGLTVVGSRSHGDAAAMEQFLGGVRVASFRPAGSSLKLCLIAEGEADLYPRLGTTMEWDIAAGHAVLRAAGGSLAAPDGAPFTYGKASEGFKNGGFVARGG